MTQANIGDILAKLCQKCSTFHIHWIYSYPPTVTCGVPDPENAVYKLETLLVFVRQQRWIQSEMSTHNHLV